MKHHEINIRVRYAETDQMGVVYHGNFAQYFEVARVEWLRELGISYKLMEQEGIMLPVVNLNINFKHPAVYDDLLKIRTCLRQKPTAKIIFDYQIFNENDVLVATAESTLVFVNIKTKKPIMCPEDLMNRLAL
jgi:acyl-CoA thioester hydrolase